MAYNRKVHWGKGYGMERKTCFFIGHRDAPETLRPLLAAAVERHITQYGVTDFVVGHYGRFDAMAASAVREVKQQHPEASLVLLTPYYPCLNDTEDFDITFYPPDMECVPKPFAIVRANEYMIRNSDYLICYDRREIGKTRDFTELARRQERKGLIHIENLAERL